MPMSTPGFAARALCAAALVGLPGAALAQSSSYYGDAAARYYADPAPSRGSTIFGRAMPSYAAQSQAMVSHTMPGQTEVEEVDEPAGGTLPDHLRRQIVSYPTSEAPGTVVIDTPNTYLYYVLGGGKAVRYGIGVGRDGFRWNGTQTVTRKAEWPDWNPPAEMIARQPYLPRFMAGGPSNPMGARAMYLGNTIYRIHGTNAPSTIGSRVSSGCIRLTNEDMTDLYSRVKIGSKVVVLPDHGRAPAIAKRSRSVQNEARAKAVEPAAPQAISVDVSSAQRAPEAPVAAAPIAATPSQPAAPHPLQGVRI